MAYEDYPKMLFKAGGDVKLAEGDFSTLIVAGEAEEAASIADGWANTLAGALELATPQKALDWTAKPAKADKSKPPVI